MSELANTIGGMALAVVLIPLGVGFVWASFDIVRDLRRALRRER